MKNLSVLVITLFFFMTGCSEEEVVPNNDSLRTSVNSDAKTRPGTGLSDLKVVGTLTNGSTFDGRVTITSLSYTEAGGLAASGFIKGEVKSLAGTVTDVKQSFTNAPLALSSGTSTSNIGIAAQCQILFLDLGPIFLDLLGLQIDLSRIVLDITAVSGGGLLGDLLCAVANLLDGGLNNLLASILGDLADFGQLLNLLNQINQLLR